MVVDLVDDLVAEGGVVTVVLADLVFGRLFLGEDLKRSVGGAADVVCRPAA